MTNGTSGRNKAIILAVLAVLAVGAGIAAFLLFTGGEEPAPTPATTPATAEAVGSIPQTGFTEVPTVQQEAPPDVVLWQEDGLDALEQYAVRSLEVIQLANPAAAQALTDLPWMGDEMLLEERLTLASVEELAQADPTLAGQVVALPWLADRVDEGELQALLQLNDIAQQDAATAQALVESPWVADGISEEEQQTLETIERLAATDSATAQALAGSSWVADGVSEEEQEGLAIVQAVAGSEPEQARELVNQARTTGGISPENAAILSKINGDIRDFIETRIEPDFPALAETIRGYPWYRDRAPHATPYHIYTLEAIAWSDPELAQRVAQWPWVAQPRINGEQAEVLFAISGLAKRREIVVGEVEVAPGLTVQQFETVEAETPELALRFAQWPWVVEGTPPATLQHVVRALVAIHSQDRRLGLEITEALSLADGIDPEEAAALRWLGKFLKYTDLSWVRSVLALPWVADGVTTPGTAGHAWTERRGLNWLLKLAANDRSQGELLLNAPWFRDGLTPEDHALIQALASTCALRVPYLELIREGQVRSRVLATPSGDVTYFIVKRASLGPIGDEAMDAMENVIRASEEFMEHPWTDLQPNVILSVEPDFTFIAYTDGLYVGPYALVRRDPPEGSKAVLYHEVAHFYTKQGPYWLIEGGANLLESYTFHFTGETTMEASYEEARGLVAGNCAPRGLGTIHQRNLAIIDWTYSQWLQDRGCDYYLGERFLTALYLELGQEMLSASLRELWFSERLNYGSNPTKERVLEIREERAYQVFLSNTPPERQDRFRLLYHCLHGRPIAGYTPSEPCPEEPPPVPIFEDPFSAVVIAQQPTPAGPESALPTQPVVIAQESAPTAPVSPEPTQPGLERPSGNNWLSAQDREALEALYHATGGPNWSRNDGWLEEDMLWWWGVSMREQGKIIGLSLENAQLTGPIPPELGQLTDLEWISFSGNQLTGPIPPELGSLTNLKSLDLSNNRLTGPIPPELGNLTNLESLHLDGNQLTGPIPPELGNLTKLRRVPVQGNQLSCVPGELEHKLPAHVFSDLDSLPFCGQETHPDRQALIALYHATDGPNWKNNRNWLSNLDLSEWYGVKWSVTGGQDDHLFLQLQDNGLRGTIPPELGSLSRLDLLNLGENDLHGTIPPELGDVPNLGPVYLHGNQLTGCIPASLVAKVTMGNQDLPPC